MNFLIFRSVYVAITKTVFARCYFKQNMYIKGERNHLEDELTRTRQRCDFLAKELDRSRSSNTDLKEEIDAKNKERGTM